MFDAMNITLQFYFPLIIGDSFRDLNRCIFSLLKFAIRLHQIEGKSQDYWRHVSDIICYDFKFFRKSFRVHLRMHLSFPIIGVVFPGAIVS